MSKKKVFLMIVAMMLVCVISVAGTLAFLQNQSNSVTNTFTGAGGLIVGNDTFFIQEHDVEKNGINYDLVETTNRTGNTYGEIEPGSVLEKDPKVVITTKTSVDAYLYIGIAATANSSFIWNEANVWTRLTGKTYTAKIGGEDVTFDIYYYNVGTVDNTTTALKDGISILDNDVVTVADSYDGSSQWSMQFISLLAQASAGSDAAEVWDATFGA